MDPFTDALRFTPLPFTPPHLTPLVSPAGRPALFLSDRGLPLVNLHLELDRGYVQEAPELFGAGVALDELMRTGGAAELSPEAVDLVIDGRALSLSIEVGQRCTTVTLNTLREHLAEAVGLLRALLTAPRFAPEAIEVWRGKQLEALRRRNDRPGPIAQRCFQRLMFGDHPVGRILEVEDVLGVDEAALRAIHPRIFRADAVIAGISGDLSEAEAQGVLDDLLGGWPGPGAPSPELPPPALRQVGGLFAIHRALPQSSIVVGQPGGIVLADTPDYFSSRVLGFILGSSGFTSRLTREMRTVRGYAYAARSTWSAARDGERPLTAITETRPETTVAALRLIQDIFQGLRDAPPTADEVRVAQDNLRHAALFEYELPSQVVSRQVGYLSQGLAPDWFERSLAGFAAATPESLHVLAIRTLRPQDLTMVVVGDLGRIGAELERLGEVTVLPLTP